ncbi:MAG: hypothetical protein LC620_02470, partial [Halobacteriales archaeon]|nr:hypothetical protein [Halobacteriales archaeon]
PHRTAVYLGLGLPMLAGVLGSALVRLVARVAARQPSARPRPRPMVMLAAVAPLALLSLVGGAVAVTPGYGHGWYRLYDACQSDALRDVAGAAELDAKATVITGSWQAKLVLAALADDANRVWYSTTYFTSEANRAGLASRHVIAVFEPHLAEADTDFFAGPGWSLLGRWCPGPDGPSVSAYVHGALP